MRALGLAWSVADPIFAERNRFFHCGQTTQFAYTANPRNVCPTLWEFTTLEAVPGIPNCETDSLLNLNHVGHAHLRSACGITCIWCPDWLRMGSDQSAFWAHVFRFDRKFSCSRKRLWSDTWRCVCLVFSPSRNVYKNILLLPWRQRAQAVLADSRRVQHSHSDDNIW